MWPCIRHILHVLCYGLADCDALWAMQKWFHFENLKIHKRLNPSTKWWSAFTTKISDPWCILSNILNITFDRLLVIELILSHIDPIFPSLLAEPPAGAGQRHHQLGPSRGLDQDRSRRHGPQAGRRRVAPAPRQPGTNHATSVFDWQKPIGYTVETGYEVLFCRRGKY